MSEANKKTPRTFSCRNSLWNTYQEMSESLECSVDYLVNDAMKHYARQRGFARSSAQQAVPTAGTPLAGAGAGAAPPPSPLSSGSTPRPAVQVPPAATPAVVQPERATQPAPAMTAAPPIAPRTHAPRPAAPPLRVNPPAPVRSAPAAPQRAPAHSSQQVTHAIPQAQLAPQRSAAPLPPPPQGNRAPAPVLEERAQPAPHLVLYHQGQAFPVSKERYIIGRGKSSSDMTIRDPNISRQHAIVELLQGVYYMVDLGSTNGIEFGGQRVQRKAIHHGDVFKICDHEVTCHLS